MESTEINNNNDYKYYEQTIQKYQKSLNDILKNKLPLVSSADELIDISKQLEALKIVSKNEMTSMINTVVIPNYENFLRNIELQKNHIGLNY